MRGKRRRSSVKRRKRPVAAQKSTLEQFLLSPASSVFAYERMPSRSERYGRPRRTLPPATVPIADITPTPLETALGVKGKKDICPYCGEEVTLTERGLISTAHILSHTEKHIHKYTPKPTAKPAKPKTKTSPKKIRALYKIQSYVTAGGKPMSSHPWFSVAGGLLGSTGAKVRTRIKLSDELSWSDKRSLEETLQRLGFEEKWNPRVGGAWGGTHYERVDYEHKSVKATTKAEKARLKANWLEHHRSQFEPYVKIAAEYGDY